MTSEIMRFTEIDDEIKYVVGLTCKTKPIFTTSGDAALDQDAAYGEYEELAADVVITVHMGDDIPCKYEFYGQHFVHRGLYFIFR